MKSRYINIDKVLSELCLSHKDIIYIDKNETAERIRKIPSIDIVRCKECKYGEYREDFDDYECHSSGCGLVYDADFFCADGERSRR